MSLWAEVDVLLRRGRVPSRSKARSAADAADNVRRLYGNRLDALERELRAAFERGARKGQREAGLARLLGLPDASPYAGQRAVDLLTAMAAEQRRVLVLVDRYAAQWGLAAGRRRELLRAAAGLNWRQAQALLRQRDRMADAGQSAAQVQRATQAYGDRLRAQRTRMIARTEDAVARNAGKEAAWRAGLDAGLVPRTARRVWVTALDERTCPTCSALDGVSVAIDEPWDAGGVAVASPGEVHPHCRCSQEIVGARAVAA